MPHTADKRTPSDTLLIRNAFSRPQKLVLASVLYAGAVCLPKQAISPGTAGSPRSDHCGQGLGGRLRASSLCPPHPQLFVLFGVAPTTLCLRTVCGLVFTRRRKGPRRQGVLGLRRAPRVGWGDLEGPGRVAENCGLQAQARFYELCPRTCCPQNPDRHGPCRVQGLRWADWGLPQPPGPSQPPPAGSFPLCLLGVNPSPFRKCVLSCPSPVPTGGPLQTECPLKPAVPSELEEGVT